MEEATLQEMETLLERRLEVIADHDFRDRDPAGHLNELRQVSESISGLHRKTSGIPARLNHFLTQCSYQKALEWIREERTSC